MLRFDHSVRLPTLAAFTSAVNRAIDVVCNAVTSAQRRIAAFFHGGKPSGSPIIMIGIGMPLPTRVPREQVTRQNFTPDGDETLPELVVFGSPRIFQSAGEYDARLLAAWLRTSRMDEPVNSEYVAWLGQFESYVMRPNHMLADMLANMSPNPLLMPQDPIDPASQFCSCGACPDGIASSLECQFLTIFRREQRFRRRAATSPAIGAINRWHTACSTQPAFGRTRC